MAVYTRLIRRSSLPPRVIFLLRRILALTWRTTGWAISCRIRATIVVVTDRRLAGILGVAIRWTRRSLIVPIAVIWRLGWVTALWWVRIRLTIVRWRWRRPSSRVISGSCDEGLDARTESPPPHGPLTEIHIPARTVPLCALLSTMVDVSMIFMAIVFCRGISEDENANVCGTDDIVG